MAEEYSIKNCCCPKLNIIGCNDTDEHNHLICLRTMLPIANDTCKFTCIENWISCPLNSTTDFIETNNMQN